MDNKERLANIEMKMTDLIEDVMSLYHDVDFGNYKADLHHLADQLTELNDLKGWRIK